MNVVIETHEKGSTCSRKNVPYTLRGQHRIGSFINSQTVCQFINVNKIKIHKYIAYAKE